MTQLLFIVPSKGKELRFLHLNNQVCLYLHFGFKAGCSSFIIELRSWSSYFICSEALLLVKHDIEASLKPTKINKKQEPVQILLDLKFMFKVQVQIKKNVPIEPPSECTNFQVSSTSMS